MKHRELTISEKLTSLALTYLVESAGVADCVRSSVIHGQSKPKMKACENRVSANSESSRKTRNEDRKKPTACADNDLSRRICTKVNGRNYNSDESVHAPLVLIDHDHAIYSGFHSDPEERSRSSVSSDDYSLVLLSTLPHERTAFANSTRQSETSDIGTQADTQREPAQITLDSEAQITSTDQLSAHSHQDDNGDESASSQATTRPKSPPNLPSIDPRDTPPDELLEAPMARSGMPSPSRSPTPAREFPSASVA